MNIALVILAVLLGLVAVIEVALRLLLGFGNPLIYLPDEEIGYLLAPNQRVRRLGNRIEINEYSMRSPPVAPMPPMGTLRVLLLGDSVANGGWWTNQDDTISALMTNQLQTSFPPGEKTSTPGVEVLNASANSWGPRNVLAFVVRFGTFGARAVVLLMNTDDLFATAPSSLAVGRDRNYPARKPPLALVEVFSRYLFPATPIPTPPKEKGDVVGRNLEAIAQIHGLCQQSNSQLLLAMTPLLRETGEPGPRNYEHQARKRLAEFTQTQGIVYLDFLPIFNSTHQTATLYRDHIHLAPAGNELVSLQICQTIEKRMLEG